MTKQVVPAEIREARSADPYDVLGSRLKGGCLQKRQSVIDRFTLETAIVGVPCDFLIVAQSSPVMIK